MYQTPRRAPAGQKPGWSTLLPWAGFIKDSTVAMFVALSLFFIPVDRKEGTRVLNWEWAVRIPWDVLILITLLTFTLGVRVLDISPGTVPVWAVP